MRNRHNGAMDVLRYASFTTDPRTGNPAGVVVAEELPTAAEMQRIATEVGYSETAFAAPVGADEFVVRYFSPVAEVDFCGHASIALGVALAERGRGRVSLRTNVGLVPVTMSTDSAGRPVAALTAARGGTHQIDPGDRDELLAALRLTADELDPAVPLMIGDSGNLHPVVALSSRDRLAALDHDDAALRRLSSERNWVTIQVVCAHGDGHWSARNPFPIGGVREDPATGSAAIALAACLRELGMIGVPTVFTIEQGLDMGRPSQLTVAVDGPGAAIRVSGTAVRIP